jgi:periplasmic glucans biosynthesis protein
VINSHNGDVDNVTVQRLAENGRWRVSFRVQPKNTQAADLHCYLSLYGESLTETWMYLWTP